MEDVVLLAVGDLVGVAEHVLALQRRGVEVVVLLHVHGEVLGCRRFCRRTAALSVVVFAARMCG